jgi:hypothetical protein
MHGEYDREAMLIFLASLAAGVVYLWTGSRLFLVASVCVLLCVAIGVYVRARRAKVRRSRRQERP